MAVVYSCLNIVTNIVTNVVTTVFITVFITIVIKYIQRIKKLCVFVSILGNERDIKCITYM